MALEKVTLKDLIKEEYRRCFLDPAYFMKKYCYIQHPTKGKVLFTLYPFQEETLGDFRKFRYNVVLKSRQLGLSTLTGGYALWLLIFNRDKNVLVIATKQDVAKNIVTKIRVMYQNLPRWLKNTELGTLATEDNKLSLRLQNGSQVKAISSSEDAGRSEALSLLILDEAAFIQKIDEIWAAAHQTLATGGDCIVLSTPNGVGNWFHQLWQKSLEKENDFNPLRLPWTLHPERDQKWRDEQDKELGKRLAAQECDADFLSSGMNVIDVDVIQFFEQTYVQEPVEKRGIDRNYWIWEQPNYSRTYLISADVARGDASDYSAAQVIDIESMTQVAEYKGLIDTRDFGDFLVTLATEWNNALLIVERENVGWATIQRIIDRGYRNLFYSSVDLQYVDVINQLGNKKIMQEKNLKPGFGTTVRTRPLIVSKLEEYINGRHIVIKSRRLIDELWVFIWNGNKPEAMPGYNDDLVMSMAIGLWVRDTALRLRQEGIELTKLTLEKFRKDQPLLYTGKLKPENYPYEWRIGGQNESLSWLLDGKLYGGKTDEKK